MRLCAVPALHLDSSLVIGAASAIQTCVCIYTASNAGSLRVLDVRGQRLTCSCPPTDCQAACWSHLKTTKLIVADPVYHPQDDYTSMGRGGHEYKPVRFCTTRIRIRRVEKATNIRNFSAKLICLHDPRVLKGFDYHFLNDGSDGGKRSVVSLMEYV